MNISINSMGASCFCLKPSKINFGNKKGEENVMGQVPNSKNLTNEELNIINNDNPMSKIKSKEETIQDLKQIEEIKGLEKIIRNEINVFANSTTNSRGVAILTDFALGVKPTELFHDPEENFLFIRTVIQNNQMLL